MARVCTICIHKQRVLIDKAIFNNVTYRKISEQYGISVATINRHKKHLKIKIQKAQDRQDRQAVKSHEQNKKRKIANLEELQEIATNLMAMNYNLASRASQQIKDRQEMRKEGSDADKKIIMQATASTAKCIELLRSFLPSEPQKIDLTMKTEEIDMKNKTTPELLKLINAA